MKKLMCAFLIVLSSLSFASDRAYFEQFLYLEENISDDPDFPQLQYRYLVNGKDIRFTSEDGSTRFANFALALFPNGTYKMVYKEMYVFDNGGFAPYVCKVLNGVWDVPNDRLEIDSDLAFAGRFSESGTNKVLLRFNRAISSSAITNIDFVLDYTYSNAGTDLSFRCFPF
jgi:hypothetical protein